MIGWEEYPGTLTEIKRLEWKGFGGTSVRVTVSNIGTVGSSGCGRHCIRAPDNHGLKIKPSKSLMEDSEGTDWLPELAHVITALAVGVDARVPVVWCGEGVDGGVGSVGASSGPAVQREDAADSKSRGTCSWRGSSKGATLSASVASSVEIVSAPASFVWEPDHGEDPLTRDRVE